MTNETMEQAPALNVGQRPIPLQNTENKRLATGAAGIGIVSGAVAPSDHGDDDGINAKLESSDGGLQLAAPLSRMPVALSVSVPVRDFRVRQLLALATGEVLETTWSHGEDLPLSSGSVQLAWTEFEVTDSRLGVRITRLG